jgi:hypothetical protein
MLITFIEQNIILKQNTAQPAIFLVSHDWSNVF